MSVKFDQIRVTERRGKISRELKLAENMNFEILPTVPLKERSSRF